MKSYSNDQLVSRPSKPPPNIHFKGPLRTKDYHSRSSWESSIRSEFFLMQLIFVPLQQTTPKIRFDCPIRSQAASLRPSGISASRDYHACWGSKQPKSPKSRKSVLRQSRKYWWTERLKLIILEVCSREQNAGKQLFESIISPGANHFSHGTTFGTRGAQISTYISGHDRLIHHRHCSPES